MTSETVSGIGLHSGRPCSVTLSRTDGDVVFRTPRGDARIDELRVMRADHGVRVACARTGLEADSVEHLLAAFAGLSIRHGVVIQVEGGEVPLADGGARIFSESLARLGVPAARTHWRIDREHEIRVGESRYLFSPADHTSLAVRIEFPGTAIGIECASWDGTPEAFSSEIAPARTFGFERDGPVLQASGRALGVDPHAVLVLDDAGRARPPAAPPREAEFARHKLLDLVGDLYLFGGPPRGKIRAVRPGHRATHRATARAIAEGVIVPENGCRP